MTDDRDQMDHEITGSKVLIVEDGPDNLHLLELFFETSGFTRVHATSDARNVEELVRELEPELVLLDLHMPHVNGIELMRRITNTVDRRIPMIVTSGDLSPENRKAGKEAGATDFLGKPYEMGALRMKVERALGQTRGGADPSA